MKASGYWQDLVTRDLPVDDAEFTVALLPVAAIEQHGPHLPLATDALIAETLASRLLSLELGDARLLVLPLMAVGDSLEHTAFPGTLSLSPETLLAAWTDIGHGVARAGVRKLVVLNTHGGQVPLVDLLAVRLRATLGMLVARANYFSLGTPEGLFEHAELESGLHGGEVETSLMLAIRPDLVRREALGDFAGLPARWRAQGRALGAESPVGFGWMSQDLHPEGVCGNAAAADATRGERLLEHLARKLAELVLAVARTPLSTLRRGPLER